MWLLLLGFYTEIRVARAPSLLASAACRGVRAIRAGGRRRRRTSEGAPLSGAFACFVCAEQPHHVRCVAAGGVRQSDLGDFSAPKLQLVLRQNIDGSGCGLLHRTTVRRSDTDMVSPKWLVQI